MKQTTVKSEILLHCILSDTLKIINGDKRFQLSCSHFGVKRPGSFLSNRLSFSSDVREMIRYV